ncbi:MAG: 1-acyl-sn-glycerol-3-phosphate acyltransferase [Alistipes sp.]|jgi:1-acyl-sn-glycerol-3-phosphate acyltransferase|nr:1-acyl-sn-glycerol-3-phosphate acyltransferase [Alistipes sp.]
MFTVLFYVVLVALLVIFLTATLLVFPFTVPFDPSRRVVHEISRGISLLFLNLAPRWRTRVEGLENVDRGRAYVIVLNHNAMVDIPMLYWVPLNFRWVSKGEIRAMPFIGQFLMLHGDILIPRDNPRKAAAMVMDDGCKWLRDRGVSVAIFPEGTRSKTGEIGRFKSGAFALAKEAGVGILPVVLSGSRVIGRHGWMPWRHDFSVTVLPPVSAEEVAGREVKEVMEEVRESMIAVQSCSI